MSINVVALSGTIDHVSWRPVGQQSNGSFQKYPKLSAKVSFANVVTSIEGTQIIIGSQTMWIELNTPKQGGDQKAVALVNKHQQGAGWFLLSDGTFSSWANNQGGIKYEIKASLSDFDIGRQSLANLNTAIIKGRVSQHNGPWLMLEDRYLNPLEQDPNKKWKSRYIPVFCPKNLPNLNDRNALVIGQVSVHTPVLQPDRVYKMTPYLHVIASEVHACLD